MATSEARDQFLNENRVASFLSVQHSKRRVSSASSKVSKPLKWPHSFLPAEEMAKAGFFFYPTQENPDNTICFLCKRSIVGWERGDNPFIEHLTLSPDCGWAVVASIDAQNEVLCQEHPLSARMIEARKATFADRWPHEGKKGWKCKVKQMVNAGWKYTPISESDDMATCVYCELALDGWEPSDKPLEEHFKRSPECTFFTVNEHRQITPKKANKSRKARASKALRFSTQSASIIDLPAEQDDSILTTATSTTVASQGGRKMARGKKAGGGRKTKAKKDEPIEISMTTDQEPGNNAPVVELEKVKPMRGRKRTSNAVDENPSALVATSHQPPVKRRAVRSTRGSVAAGDDTHVLASVEKDADIDTRFSEIVPEKMTASRKKGRGSTTKSTRNFSSSSIASKASLQMAVLDDDEIERVLQADLERPLTDEEDGSLISKLEKSDTAAPLAPVWKTGVVKTSNVDHVMFGLGENKVDEAAIEIELEAMEIEDSAVLAKAKGAKRKQGRKPSAKSQAAAKRAAHSAQIDVEVKKVVEPQNSRDERSNVHSPEVPNIDNSSSHTILKRLPVRSTRASGMLTNMSNSSLLSLDQHPTDIHLDSGNESDASMASQTTIIKSGPKRRGSVLKNTKSAKKIVPKHIEEIVSNLTDAIPMPETAPRKRAGRMKKAIHVEEIVVAEDTTCAPLSVSQQPSSEKPTGEPTHTKPTSLGGGGKVLSQPLMASDAELARQNTPISPQRPASSLSPQSSDAENRPPSKLSSVKPPTYVCLPLTSTPIPSPKCNIVAGLQTTFSWTAVDLDEIFLRSPENEITCQSTNRQFDMALENAKKGDLSSPERKMTVEEWIMFNAGQAEEKLRRECERMVGVFEKEGGRAMRVLEGIDCLE